MTMNEKTGNIDQAAPATIYIYPGSVFMIVHQIDVSHSGLGPGRHYPPPSDLRLTLVMGLLCDLTGAF